MPIYTVMSNYEIKRIKGGTDNCYLVSHGRDAILFDTGSGTACEMVINECSKYDLKLIVLSHTHFDHAENAAVISEKFGVPVAYHEADDELFDDYDAQPLRSYGLVGFAVLQLSLKALRETNVKRPSNRFYVKDGDTFEEYGFPDIKVVELPGHTKGSIGLLVQDFALLAGDALDNWIKPAKGHLFYDIDVMNKTYRLIHSLGDRTVYYGHGNPTKN